MIELQLKLLGDKIRNQAFFAALKKVIKKGKTEIADIGSGTGFLSFLASRLGAKKCWLYEYADIIKISKAIAAANRIKNCEFMQKHSADVKNPHVVDIVISETLGNFALEENIIETLEDAKRFLKPGGRIIPRKIQQFIAPINSRRIFDTINICDTVGFGLNITAAKETSLNNMYVYKILPQDIAGGRGAEKMFDEIDFGQKNNSMRKGRASWKFNNDEHIYGFGVWWTAELLDGIRLSTSPFEPRTHWDQIFLPFIRPLRARKNQTLEAEISSDSRYKTGIRVTWEARVEDAQKRRIDQVKMDTRKGNL